MKPYREQLMLQGELFEVKFLSNRTSHPAKMVGLHWHDAYEILYVRRGFGEQRINSEIFRFYPTDVIVIAPGDIHATTALSDDGCDIDVLHFTKKLIGESRETAEMLRSGIIRHTDNYIGKVMGGFASAQERHGLEEEWMFKGLSHMLIGSLVGLRKNAEETPKSSAELRRIQAYIEEAKDLSLKSVASRFGYSEEHLSRKFHKELGVNFREWCGRIKMRRALSLLREDKLSISEIAESLGYCDESSFTRAFKRVYGVTPNACKRKQVTESVI